MSILWTQHLKCQGGSGWLCVYVYVCVSALCISTYTVHIYVHCVYLSIYLSANTGCATYVYLIPRQFLPSIGKYVWQSAYSVLVSICGNVGELILIELMTYQRNIRLNWMRSEHDDIYNHSICMTWNSFKIRWTKMEWPDFSSPWVECKVWDRKTRPETCLFCTAADSNYHQQARCVYTMCLF